MTLRPQEHHSLPSKRIAIAGLGEIGKTVARKLAQGLSGLALAAVVARDQAKAKLDRERGPCPVVSLGALPGCDGLVEKCAPAPILDQICCPVVSGREAQ